MQTTNGSYTPDSLADRSALRAPPASLLMLAATATTSARGAPRDPLATRLFRALQVDAFTASWTRHQLATALACVEVLDGIVRRWTRANPDGRVVEVGAPLSTRHARLGDAAPLFTSVDERGRSALRLTLLDPMRIHQMTTGSISDRGWIRRLVKDRRPLLALVPDLFLDVTGDEVVEVLVSLSAELATGDEVAAVFGCETWPVALGVGGSRHVALERSRRVGVSQTMLPRLAWRGRPTRRLGPEEVAIAHLVVD